MTPLHDLNNARAPAGLLAAAVDVQSVGNKYQSCRPCMAWSRVSHGITCLQCAAEGEGK